jgi:DNA-directed RNA polymerase subunit RPC12/RpoP
MSKYIVLQCSRCGDKVLVTKDEDGNPVLPDGWYATSHMLTVSVSNVYICPTCYNLHLRAAKLAGQIRSNLGGPK